MNTATAATAANNVANNVDTAIKLLCNVCKLETIVLGLFAFNMNYTAFFLSGNVRVVSTHICVSHGHT